MFSGLTNRGRTARDRLGQISTLYEPVRLQQVQVVEVNKGALPFIMDSTYGQDNDDDLYGDSEDNGEESSSQSDHQPESQFLEDEGANQGINVLSLGSISSIPADASLQKILGRFQP